MPQIVLDSIHDVQTIMSSTSVKGAPLSVRNMFAETSYLYRSTGCPADMFEAVPSSSYVAIANTRQRRTNASWSGI